MSPRTTRSLVLGLIGSAAMLTLFWSCQRNEEEERQRALAADGQPTGTVHSSTTHYGHSYYRSRSWFGGWGWGGPSYYSSYRSGPSGFSSTSGSASGGSSSSSSVTSRGGFGSTGGGHASAGG